MHSQQQSTYSKNVKISAELTSYSQKQGLYQKRIPRLVLLAALIGSRCMKFVENELKVEICQKHIWLDSQCALNWIQSERPLGTFVENRVKEIKT